MISPEKMFEMLDVNMKEVVERTLSELLKSELTAYLGREKYVRSDADSDVNYRNGSYRRSYAVKGAGNVELEIPRDRDGSFKSNLVKRYERRDSRINQDAAVLFLSGLSTRGLQLISKRLLGTKISAGEVSNVAKDLLSGIDAWRLKPLHDYKIKYMCIDGVYFHTRVNHKVEKVPILVVIGVTEDNRKLFLGLQQGDKDSASTWREVFKDLKTRGLDPNYVQLGIMDGLPGLMTVFKEEFTNAKIQRCQVHVSRNVLCKVPHSAKGEVVDSLRNIFYAASKKVAVERYNRFVDKYNSLYPSAVKCLSNVVDECLTFYTFPEEEWKSLRTTNGIERVNKEFKRRTKPMEILAGEASTYRILGFVCLKMESNWKTFPYKNPNADKALEVFTQLC
jgi:putative transposase